MARKNIFTGDGHYSKFAKSAYELLKTRRWITNLEIAQCAGYDTSRGVSNIHGYGELKKAVSDIIDAIRAETQNEKSIEKRNGQIRYTGKEDDPLSKYQQELIRVEFEKYYDFCQDSNGMLPQIWVEHFFSGSKDLCDMRLSKQEGQQIISASLDCESRNIELLPRLYEFIKSRQVIEIQYKPYAEAEKTLVIHPHYIKEYNGRWHLYGHAEGEKPDLGYDLALDRIESKKFLEKRTKYKAAPKNYYRELFQNRVGVSNPTTPGCSHVRIRALNKNIFGLISTKKLHSSQEVTIPFGNYADGEYGEFSLFVEINIELKARILMMGEGLQVMEPESLVKSMQTTINAMNEIYNN